MKDSESRGDVSYPQTSIEWRVWIQTQMDIDETHGAKLVDEGAFPHNRLVSTWEREFTVEKGYSPQFIPALTRNVLRFLSWVYGGSSEPNWTKSDD